jgi:hypothetical protein
MDIGTIRAKINSGAYNRRKDLFIAEVRLCLVNAVSRNSADYDATIFLNRLLAIFETTLANVRGVLFGDSRHEVNPMQNVLQGLIDALIARTTSQNFYRPLGAAALDMPDHPKVMKQPMDFEKISRDVDLGTIATLDSFQAAIFSLVSTLTYIVGISHNIVHTTVFACGHLAIRGVAIARLSTQPPPVPPWSVSTNKKIAPSLPQILSNSMMRKTFIKVLTIIMTDPCAELYFNVPVDQVVLAIPDYYKVIKRAMDLGTVFSRVKHDHYSQARSFFDDVALVFSNAMVYNNNPSHPVFVAAAHLDALFKYTFNQTIGPVSHIEPVKMQSMTPQKSAPLVERVTTSPSRVTANDTSWESCVALAADLDNFQVENSKMRRLIGVLRSKPVDANFFLKKVNSRAPGMHDYARIVNEPMDLSTIEAQVDAYATIRSFVCDLQLVFDNARMYIPNQQLAVHYAANVLSRTLNESLHKVVSSFDRRTAKQGMDLPKCNLDLPPAPASFSNITCVPFEHRTFPLIYPAPRLSDKSESRCILLASTWKVLAKDLLASSSCIDAHLASRPPWRNISEILDSLWRTSRSDSLTRQHIAASEAAAREKRILEATDREARLHKERLADLERDRHARQVLDTKAREAEVRSQLARDEARQRAREAARRRRDKLQQTVDIDQHREALSSFLKSAVTAPSTASPGIDRSPEGRD